MITDIQSITCTRKVVKANKLIEMPYPRNLQAIKATALCIALVNSTDISFRESYSLSFRQVAYFLGITKSHNYKAQIERAFIEANKPTYRLSKNVIAKLWASINFRDDGYIDFEFSRHLKKYLINLKKNFTEYQLYNILVLNSKHSARIYEVLKMWRHRKTAPVVTLDDLREMLAIRGYARYTDFKRYVLEPARNDLYSYTDIGFNYQEIKGRTGKAIRAVRFSIYDVKTVQDHDIQQRFKALRELQELFTSRQDAAAMPLNSPNTKAYDNAYFNFINNRHNYPPGFTFEQHCSDNGLQIVAHGRGKHLTAQASLPI